MSVGCLPIIHKVIACRNSHAATRVVRSAPLSASSATCEHISNNHNNPGNKHHFSQAECRHQLQVLDKTLQWLVTAAISESKAGHCDKADICLGGCVGTRLYTSNQVRKHESEAGSRIVSSSWLHRKHGPEAMSCQATPRGCHLLERQL